MIGRSFAYRERAKALGEPVQPVEVVKEGPSRFQKVRIRYLDGELEGLEEWVPKLRLLVPWEDSKAFCEDEKRLVAAVEAAEEAHGTVRYGAVQWVFYSLFELINEELVLTGWKAFERDLVIIKDFQNSVRKLDLDAGALISKPYAFVDRNGDYKAPFAVAEDLAKLFCQRYPKQILHHIRLKEDKHRRETIETADLVNQRINDTFLDKWKLEFSLVLEWCGDELVVELDEVDILRKEITRLRTLIKNTASWLEANGHPVKAKLVLQELDKYKL